MFMSSTASTRRVPPSHKPWVPHPYQQRGVEFLCQQGSAALFLDPGMGKTSIVLSAFATLATSALATRMLVVAPLRVIQTVWEAEAKKWTQFRHLKFSTLHGPKKQARLKDDADIWLINPEGCQWLSDQYFGRSLPFDTVVIDELTKFKNPKSVRSKTLRPRLKNVRRRWGLTGTPIPNGYLDLFGQFLMLDDGAALGKYVTHYRDTYFQPDFNGFDYQLQPGGAARIEAKIAPYVLRMAAEDYLDLPPLVDDVRLVDLEPAAKATYAAMKKDMLAELPEGVVTGANAAAVYSKLKQMANGAVYLGEGTERKVSTLHATKLDAVEELVEELCGAPLLLAYEFNHDLDRLKAKLGVDTPHLGSGVNAERTKEIVAEWNAGKIPVLLAHPASAGHGLNLQGSGAGHIGWFGPIWDLELYEQFIQRVHRQGTTALRTVTHIFVARDTIDELVLVALRDKSITQDKMLANLNTEILRDAGSPTAGNAAVQTQELTMQTVQKLSRQNGAGGVVGAVGTNTGPAERPRIVPKGWPTGAPKAAETTYTRSELAGSSADEVEARQVNPIEQRQAVTRRLTERPAEVEQPEEAPVQVRVKAMFSAHVRDRLEGKSAEDKAMDQPNHGHDDKPEHGDGVSTALRDVAEPAEAGPATPAKDTLAPRKRAPRGTVAPATDYDDAELRKWALERAIDSMDIGSPEMLVAAAAMYVAFVQGTAAA